LQDKSEIISGEGIFTGASGIILTTALGDVTKKKESLVLYVGSIIVPASNYENVIKALS